jgi:hypothetical protein
MDNQHQKITGYRDLTQDEIDLMNKGKELANAVGAFCNALAARAKEDPTSIDPRWVAIGQTDLQKGFMALTRSIAKPTTF